MASRLATASATDRVLSVNVSNARTRKSVTLVAAVADKISLDPVAYYAERHP